MLDSSCLQAFSVKHLSVVFKRAVTVMCVCVLVRVCVLVCARVYVRMCVCRSRDVHSEVCLAAALQACKQIRVTGLHVRLLGVCVCYWVVSVVCSRLLLGRP